MIDENTNNAPSLIIEESGMKFGPFSSDQLFHIEQCDLYQSRLKSKGVASTEFVWRKDSKLWFVEAKTSTPNYATCGDSEDKKKKYEKFVTSIVTKFRDSIDIYASILIKRNACEQLPASMGTETASTHPIVFVLVIKEAFPDTLIHFNDKFRKELAPMMRIWNIENFVVISEAQAKRKGLISDSAAS